MLVNKQQEFAVAIAKLVLYATEIGLPVTFGDAYRDPRLHGEMGIKKGYGMASSCHKLRLAVDLNIIKDGKIADVSEYKKLQKYWHDNLGGSELIEEDANHFSWAHEGHR
jgi:hypothetical protein